MYSDVNVYIRKKVMPGSKTSYKKVLIGELNFQLHIYVIVNLLKDFNNYSWNII